MLMASNARPWEDVDGERAGPPMVGGEVRGLSGLGVRAARAQTNAQRIATNCGRELQLAPDCSKSNCVDEQRALLAFARWRARPDWERGPSRRKLMGARGSRPWARS